MLHNKVKSFGNIAEKVPYLTRWKHMLQLDKQARNAKRMEETWFRKYIQHMPRPPQLQKMMPPVRLPGQSQLQEQ